MTYVVAGFGKFGRRALERLTRAFPTSAILVLERNAERRPCDLPVTATFFHADAVSFLLDSPLLQDDDVVIPMVPVHLAADCLLAAVPGLRKVSFPSDLSRRVPNPYAPDAESLCCSYADFLCPDDCPAGACCTVTGEQRDPLFSVLEGLTLPGFNIMVLRSLQILPGVGGYPLRDLLSLGKSLARGSSIVATACRCHAVMTALAL
jgi:hypothetical protein